MATSLLLPWNQRSLQISNRAGEWASSRCEVFSVVASARFDTRFHDICSWKEVEEEGEKERKLLMTSCKCPVGTQVMCTVEKVQCLVCEVKRTRCVH